MKRLLALILLTATAAFGQGGRLTQDPWVSNRLGNPAAGVTVSVCAPLATTAASLASTIATFTMASNPVTAGFKSGMNLQIAGFTGGDTFFNAGILANGFLTGGVPIILVTATQVIAGPIAHADGTAGTNGTLLQMGNSTTSCAGLSALYSDSLLSVTTPNPLTTDGLGNYGTYIAPGIYYTQWYGSGITTTMRPMAVACVPLNSANCGALLGTANNWTALQNFSVGFTVTAGTATFAIAPTPTTASSAPLGSPLLPWSGVDFGQAANQYTQLTSLATVARGVAIPDATGTVSLVVVEYCGATSGAGQPCAKTVQTLPIIIWGDVLLNGAVSQSITTLPFTDALYSCTGSDLTTPTTGIVSFTTYASASVTILETSGTNADHLRYVCVGH
jgi:hypothetical protein